MLLAKPLYLPRHLPGHGTTSVQDGQGEVHQGHHRREQAANTDFANSIRPIDETKQHPARRPAGPTRCPLKQAQTGGLRG